MVETTKKYYRIDRREISFLKFILEAYDGLAVLTTVDSEKGIVVINIAPGCEGEVEMILQDLKKSVMIEKIPSKNQLSE
jgi:uncharacterized protein DUF4911